jgi:fucose permease
MQMRGFKLECFYCFMQMRTVRLGLANACWCLGSVVGLLLSGILFQSGGEILVFSSALALEVLAFAVSVWRVRVFF